MPLSIWERVGAQLRSPRALQGEPWGCWALGREGKEGQRVRGMFVAFFSLGSLVHGGNLGRDRPGLWGWDSMGHQMFLEPMRAQGDVCSPQDPDSYFPLSQPCC